MKAVVGTSGVFEIGVEFHQGSALSSRLEATKEARGETPWDLLYADDWIVNGETAEVKK